MSKETATRDAAPAAREAAVQVVVRLRPAMGELMDDFVINAAEKVRRTMHHCIGHHEADTPRTP